MPDVLDVDNCLFWALRQWQERGGYVAWRRSHYYPGPHFLWIPAGAFPAAGKSFVPIDPTRRLVPPLLFRGMVRAGD